MSNTAIAEEQATKACQFCGAIVLDVAIECKQCGSNLNEPAGSTTPTSTAGISADTANIPETLGLVALGIPMAAIALIWLWVGSMNLLQSPGSKLNLILCLTVFSTAILIAAEAAKLGMGGSGHVPAPEGPTSKKSFRLSRGKKKKGDGPVGWLVGCIFLWPIYFPAYFYKRSKFGQKNLLGWAITVTVVFVWIFVLMSSAIDERMAEVRGFFER